MQDHHTPLHLMHQPGQVQTAGRLWRQGPGWVLANADATIIVEFTGLEPQQLIEGQLIQVQGLWDGRTLRVHNILYRSPERAQAPDDGRKHRAHRARARLNHQIRRFFDQRGFMEVQTPSLVPEPGTDLHLDPFRSFFLPEASAQDTQNPTIKNVLSAYLQTSPELMMKRMLVEGHERIYQLTHAWRNGEVTDLHQPEFTILEWYRAWSSMDVIMDDVEQLVRQALDSQDVLSDRGINLHQPFERITMQELVQRACGFDLLEHLNLPALKEACAKHLPHLNMDVDDWDELFFEMQIDRIDPYLEQMGAVFVTHWPRPLAVLARGDGQDPRVALRFELYLGGLELANGFDELTDPYEQRQRFTEDVRRRRALRLPDLPMPTRFLDALERGMPPSAGVAMGVDRLLMLACGAKTIGEVLPFGLIRRQNQIQWG